MSESDEITFLEREMSEEEQKAFKYLLDAENRIYLAFYIGVGGDVPADGDNA